MKVAELVMRARPIDLTKDFEDLAARRFAALVPGDEFLSDATIPSSSSDSPGSASAGTGGVSAPFQVNAQVQCLARCRTRSRRSGLPGAVSRCRYRPAERSAFHLREASPAPSRRRPDTSQSRLPSEHLLS